MSRISTNSCDWHDHNDPDGSCDCLFKCDSCSTEYEQGMHSSQDCVKVLVKLLYESKEECNKAIEGRKHTWDWCTGRYGKLEDWARKQLPEPFKTEFFNCVANGLWSCTLDNAPPYICNAGMVIRPSGYFHMKDADKQLLYDQWKRAEDAEAALKELKGKLAERHKRGLKKPGCKRKESPNV